MPIIIMCRSNPQHSKKINETKRGLYIYGASPLAKHISPMRLLNTRKRKGCLSRFGIWPSFKRDTARLWPTQRREKQLDQEIMDWNKYWFFTTLVQKNNTMGWRNFIWLSIDIIICRRPSLLQIFHSPNYQKDWRPTTSWLPRCVMYLSLGDDKRHQSKEN